jgi:hypothetical protein
LQTESAALQQAIQAHKDYIGNETLTVEWPASLNSDAATAQVKIDGQPLVIQLQKLAVPHSVPALKPQAKKTVSAPRPGKPAARSKPVKKRKTPSAKHSRKRPTKKKTKAASQGKATTAKRRKARPAPASAAHKNSMPGRRSKKPPRPKTAPKAKPKKAGVAKKSAKIAMKSRKKTRTRT